MPSTLATGWNVVSPALKIRSAPAGSVTLSSSGSSKVMVSAVPLTAALTNPGPVMSPALSTVWAVSEAASFPARSCSGFVPGV